MSLDHYISTLDGLHGVTAACKRAPAGPARDAALLHCDAARTAFLAGDQTRSLEHLGAAKRVLG